MANNDLLSQDEIDALLSGVDSGDVVTEGEDSLAADGTRSYDFASQDRIVRGRMPTLEMINERFARNLRVQLFNMLRRSPVISVEGVQMVKFGEYVHSLLMPSNLNVIKIKPLRGSAGPHNGCVKVAAPARGICGFSMRYRWVRASG